ncbi:NAD(P)-binding protein [Lipomyces kononenkoae]|uniref:NAD(P)-binding protein n=1 Tax=Lipomyces kononenkoae TaxID=34357 RepID=A0ACC3SU14_LIPKO
MVVQGHEVSLSSNEQLNGITAVLLLSKQAIESEVRNAGFEKWTLLRPGFFMTNFLYLEPDRFNSKEIELVSELMGFDTLMEILSSASGRDIKAVYLSPDEIGARKSTDVFVAAQQAMQDMDQFVDMDQLKAWGFPLGTFESYISY